MPEDKSEITEDYIKSIANTISENEYRSFRARGENQARIYFKNAFATINLKTGKGEIEYVKPIPVLKQMTILHQTTNKW